MEGIAVSALTVMESTDVDSLTPKQQAVARPIVDALARLASPQSAKDRGELERLILRNGVELDRMRRTLEAALTTEDERLRSEGTTDELDDRWIRNLRRLEVICDLLNDAKGVAGC
jgi:hypothetical protein